MKPEKSSYKNLSSRRRKPTRRELEKMIDQQMREPSKETEEALRRGLTLLEIRCLGKEMALLNMLLKIEKEAFKILDKFEQGELSYEDYGVFMLDRVCRFLMRDIYDKNSVRLNYLRRVIRESLKANIDFFRDLQEQLGETIIEEQLGITLIAEEKS